MGTQTSVKPTMAVLGLAPKKPTNQVVFIIMDILFFFRKKKQKALFRFAEG
jgi:hypothetical protein